MLNGKDILVDALEKAIANFDVANEQKRTLTFDNTEYKAFLTSFNSPKDIVNLSEGMIDKLATNIEVNESKYSFIATIKFLKGLAEISNKEDANISLNSNQLAVIEELKRLVVQTIDKNDSLISILGETSEETNLKYIRSLSLLKSNNLFTEKDYDLIEEVVMKLCAKDNGPVLDDVMTYLNERNAEKLEKIYKGEKLDANGLEALKDSELLQRMRETEKKQEELLSKINVRLAEFIQISKKKSKNYKGLANIERSQKCKEIFASFGYNFDKMSINLKTILLDVENIDELGEFAKYLNEKNPIIIKNINENNLTGLVYLLTASNQEIVENVLHELAYVHELSEEIIAKFLNQITTIFGKKYYENFLALSKIIKEQNANIFTILNASPLFFLTDAKKIKAIIKLLSSKGANLKSILENCAIAIGKDPELIEKNIKLLEVYGFSLESFFKEKESCYILLNSKDLATKLDGLIEVGLNEYIHGNPEYSGNSLRTIIIKRVYYAFKNNLEVWGNNISLNSEFNKMIREAGFIIDESIISLLIAEHPIIAKIDDKHRSGLYETTPLAQLKRKTEIYFGNRIISRLKAYYVFKILIQNEVLEKEALLYALAYKTPLDNEEYSFIQKAVEKVGAL